MTLYRKHRHSNLTEECLKKYISNNIVAIRRRKYISQAELAMAIGVCKSQMLNYENAHHKISIYRLNQICKVLDIDFIQLLESIFYPEPEVEKHPTCVEYSKLII